MNKIIIKSNRFLDKLIIGDVADLIINVNIVVLFHDITSFNQVLGVQIPQHDLQMGVNKPGK